MPGKKSFSLYGYITGIIPGGGNYRNNGKKSKSKKAIGCGNLKMKCRRLIYLLILRDLTPGVLREVPWAFPSLDTGTLLYESLPGSVAPLCLSY